MLPPRRQKTHRRKRACWRRSTAAATASFYDAARAEGKLVIYGGGQAALFEPVQQAFNKRYPGIAVENVDQRGRESREKVFAEQRGKNFVADIVTSGFSTQTEILEAGFVEVYQSASIPDVIPELMTNPGYFNPRTVSIFSVSVNTNLVPQSEEPKTWDDVMNPKWRGKIGLDDPREADLVALSLRALSYPTGWNTQRSSPTRSRSWRRKLARSGRAFSAVSTRCSSHRAHRRQ